LPASRPYTREAAYLLSLRPPSYQKMIGLSMGSSITEWAGQLETKVYRPAKWITAQPYKLGPKGRMHPNGCAILYGRQQQMSALRFGFGRLGYRAAAIY